jgi:hypothetical protein
LRHTWPCERMTMIDEWALRDARSRKKTIAEIGPGDERFIDLEELVWALRENLRCSRSRAKRLVGMVSRGLTQVVEFPSRIGAERFRDVAESMGVGCRVYC